ncbi:PREDICTED: putative F-box protein At1g65770 [Fragaria vesca subsp. vesca]|uniref:putative F-box protein At1g65770 n=1 Tax=Fragaria vesca subsp. vesca TaxID=101020 RepID=UPI0002C2F10B|nr:PREDICTED: putative F-box protein At1g65770 [Fragaria vesca subsp. vesca]
MGNVSSDSNYSGPASETLFNRWEGTPNMNNLESVAAWNQRCPTRTSYDDNVVPSSVIEWQGLPEELVMLIIDKLLETVDYVRFAAVCKEWYRLAKDKHARDTDSWYGRRRPPMLFLPPTPTVDLPVLLNVSRMTPYKNIWLQVLRLKVVCLDQIGYIFCCSSSHGWLAKVGLQDLYRPDPELVCRIELFNSFRQATTQRIPPFTFKPDHTQDWRLKAPRVVLSSDPALNRGNLWLLVFLTNGNQLAFHMRGQDSCSCRIVRGRGSEFTDAIFYRGRFYAIDNRRGLILAFDVEEANWRALKIDGFESSSYRAYLVESTKGDLLCLNRFVKPSTNQARMKETMSFKVYKLELDNQLSTTVTQVEVTNIDDQTLFVGDTPSVSVVASDFGGCRPNSIYFTDDSMTCPRVSIELLPQYEPQGVKYDVGIFSLAEQSITPYNGRHFGPPFWITTPPPFDPLPVSTSTGWTRDWTRDPTGSNSLELTAVSKQDKRKRSFKHWLSCFSTKE